MKAHLGLSRTFCIKESTANGCAINGSGTTSSQQGKVSEGGGMMSKAVVALDAIYYLRFKQTIRAASIAAES